MALLLPYGPMLRKTKKKSKGKNPNLKFTVFVTALVQTLSRSKHEFGEVNLVCTFRGYVLCKF